MTEIELGGRRAEVVTRSCSDLADPSRGYPGGLSSDGRIWMLSRLIGKMRLRGGTHGRGDGLGPGGGSGAVLCTLGHQSAITLQTQPHRHLWIRSAIGVITHWTRGECEPANASRGFRRFIRGVAAPTGASWHGSTVGRKVHIRGDSRVGSARCNASRIRRLCRTGC